MSAITKEDKSKFLDLACQLSPENLCCDGEISMAQARRRAHFIKEKWARLEKKISQTVTEDDVWKWAREDETL